MTWKLKGTLLAAAVATTVIASQAQASFTYDLRFAPSTSGVSSDGKTAPVGSGGTYTLQLWGQISGDSVLNNDSYAYGYVSVVSSQTAGGAITAGGITAAQTGTNVSVVSQDGAQANISTDGISDWGGASTTSFTGYLEWRGGSPPGYVAGSANTQSEQVNANTWEVLLATYTVNATAEGTGSTTFNVVAPASIKASINPTQGTNYYQDEATPNGTANVQNVTTVSAGVTFTGGGGVTTPEPASLGLLALGGLALMNRRRKA